MFYQLPQAENELHEQKNHDDAVEEAPLENLKRVTTWLAQYPGLNLHDPAVVAFVFALKQIDTYLWMKSNKHTAQGEGITKRLHAAFVYMKLVATIERERLEKGSQKKSETTEGG